MTESDPVKKQAVVEEAAEESCTQLTENQDVGLEKKNLEENITSLEDEQTSISMDMSAFKKEECQTLTHSPVIGDRALQEEHFLETKCVSNGPDGTRLMYPGSCDHQAMLMQLKRIAELLLILPNTQVNTVMNTSLHDKNIY